MLALNSNQRENKLKLFFRQVPNYFFRSQSFIAVTGIVKHMLINTTFLLYTYVMHYIVMCVFLICIYILVNFVSHFISLEVIKIVKCLMPNKHFYSVCHSLNFHDFRCTRDTIHVYLNFVADDQIIINTELITVVIGAASHREKPCL